MYRGLTFISDPDADSRGQGALLQNYAVELLLSCGKFNLAEQVNMRSAAFRDHESRTYENYRYFVRQHMPALGGDKALAWCFANHTNSCVHLTEARIKSIIIALFRERKQELKCDMMRRSGGQIIASDATHKVIGRTDSEGNKLVVFVGADRTVLWFGVTRSESYEELGSALDKLADRFKRLGTNDDLIGWYTDTCCNGLKPENLHCHKLRFRSDGAGLRFPNLTHWHLLDAYHAINRVTQAANSAAVGEVVEIAADMSASLFALRKDDVDQVVEYLRSPKRKKYKESGAPRPTLSIEEAQARAVNNYDHSGLIRRFPHCRADQRSRLLKTIDKWKKRKAIAKEQNKQCAIRSCGRRRIGTIRAMELILDHVDKGCLQYPLPCEEMYINIRKQPKTCLQERMALQGTSKVESVNAEVNRIVDGVGQLSQDLTEPYLFFKFGDHNHKRDKALGREDQECVWLDAHKCDAINNEASQLFHGPLPFPCASEPRIYPQLPPPAKYVFIPEGDPNDEAFGFDYLDLILAREAERDALRDDAAEVRGTPGLPMQGGGPGVAPLSAEDGGADSACSDDDRDDVSPPSTAAPRRKRSRAVTNSDDLEASTSGQQRSGSMKTPIGRAFGVARTKLRICKPTSAEERCLAKQAANQAYDEEPAGNKKTFDRATAIYNQMVAAKAATDTSFMLHKTTSRHMREFLFQSQASYVAAIRLDGDAGGAHTLGTNLARPCLEASNVEDARDAATAGPTADAVQHPRGAITQSALHDLSPPPKASVDAVPSCASPKSNAPAVTNSKLPTNPTTEPPKKSKHSAYNSRERSAALVVQCKGELKGLNIIELKRVASHLGIRQKVAGELKKKEALLADIEATWTDTHSISLPEALSPSS
jgi:hypothetical protein